MSLIKVDLPTHSSCSDGNFPPPQLLNILKNSGLSIASLTDHDSVNGVSEAIDYGNKIGITVIPGVEISSDLDDQEIHILGYFVDHKNKKLLEFLNASRDLRIIRNEKIIEKLNSLGSNINIESIVSKAGINTSIGRPHIAIELNNEGFVSSYYDAFIKYIGDGKPAFVKKTNPQASEVIKLISEVGGLSFIAHPGKMVRGEMLLKLLHEGLDGIEVIHPSHSKEDIEYFTAMAAEHFLLTSGGSDFHGGVKNDGKNLGKFYVEMNQVINMKRRLFQ